MSIEISLGVKRTITEHVNGSFTTNHPEDVVREWMQSVEDWEERDEIHSGLETDVEEGWKVLYASSEENDDYEETPRTYGTSVSDKYFVAIEHEHIFDDEIQMWIDAGNNLTN